MCGTSLASYICESVLSFGFLVECINSNNNISISNNSIRKLLLRMILKAQEDSSRVLLWIWMKRKKKEASLCRCWLRFLQWLLYCSIIGRLWGKEKGVSENSIESWIWFSPLLFLLPSTQVSIYRHFNKPFFVVVFVTFDLWFAIFLGL